MRVFDVSTEVIKQGGRRRGANMGILHMDHPDIEKFVVAKRKNVLTNFNISVTVNDKFMEQASRGGKYPLVNPRGGKRVGMADAKKLFGQIVESAWMTGDPGLVFIDEINRKNPVPALGEIESTNPCGEQPLLPYESCNLGSVNLSRMVYEGKINWEKLGETVKVAVRFLDNVIDVNKYPFIQIKKVTRANRKIGLGVMGFAEMLIQLGIPYDSEKGLKTAEKVMKFISEEAHKASEELANRRGAFPNFAKSRHKKKVRNATVTTIAPTGTISIIAGTSSGIEPLFAVSYVRKFEGGELLETNWLFERIAKERGFYSRGLMEEISMSGSVQKIPGIPVDVKRLFVTALDIKPEWHVRMQAAFQKYTDNAVSKTVNLPKNATKNDIKKIYLLAHKLKCKGITVYRYGSKEEQVLYIDKAPGIRLEEGVVKADSEYTGECNICSV
jgi:ribonucleoside-diphosphate reductase alpha chain